MSVTLRGVDAHTAALAALEKAGDLGARDGIVAAGRKLTTVTRTKMGGDPRWSRRGAGRTGPAVDTGRRPINVPRGGGPGDLTGNLRKGVHSLKPRKDLAGWRGGVSAMGGRDGNNRNLYAPVVEDRHPFLKPALTEFEPQAPAIFERAWALRIGKV